MLHCTKCDLTFPEIANELSCAPCVSGRIRKVMQSDPLRLLWLAMEPADCPCPKRKAFCCNILNSDEQILQNTTLRLRDVYRDELPACASGGGGKLSMMWWLITTRILSAGAR